MLATKASLVHFSVKYLVRYCFIDLSMIQGPGTEFSELYADMSNVTMKFSVFFFFAEFRGVDDFYFR